MIKNINQLSNRKGLVVCSAGGHLTEALMLAQKLGFLNTSLFITHENPQSISLLEKIPHEFVPYVKSRELFKAIKVYLDLRKITKNLDFDFILSTGAAVSISALLLHLRSGKPFIYNELLTRVFEPSFSGKILEKFSSVQLYSPHSQYFSAKWKNSPSLLESYAKEPKTFQKSKDLKVFVSLGTMSPYRFDRLVDVIRPILREGDRVIWQLGCTHRNNLPGTTLAMMSNQDFLQEALSADVVVCHAGVGSLLDLITNGIRPVVVPRLAKLKEHIDDHQVELAGYFSKIDLVFVPTDEITREVLVQNSQYRIIGKN